MTDFQNGAASAPRAATARLGDVCRLAGDLQLSLPASQRIARKGPYPLYAENCVPIGIDEYAIDEGGAIMVSSFGQVLTSAGYLAAAYEPGRCSATEHVHALIPHDPADGRYIWRVLTTTPKAARMVTGTTQVRQISGSALLTVPIPWPERSVREAYVAALDAYDARAVELAEAVPRLFAQGDDAFARTVLAASDRGVPCGSVARFAAGTNVAAADRAPDKPVRIEGPQGRLGHCDEVLTRGPAVMVGPSGRRLLAHFVDEPSHPIAEMLYVEQDAAQAPLSVLLFALRAAGLYDRIRQGGVSLDAPLMGIDELESLVLHLGTPEAQEAFAPVADDLLARICQAQRDADRCAADRHAFVRRFIATSALEGPEDGLPNSVRGELPEPRGVSKTFERAQADARALLDARGRAGGACVEAVARTDGRQNELGPLAALVETGLFGLAPADAAWELAPLAVVRAVAGPALWEQVARAAREGACGAPSLADVLDHVMGELARTDDLLSFLPNLSYQSSLLSADQLAAWVRALDAVEASELRGGHIRAIFDLEPGWAQMPLAVRVVVDRTLAAVASRLPAGFETAYVPCEAREGMVDALGRVLPRVTLRAQFDEFSSMLAAAMVRAVELRGSASTRGGLGAAAGCSLTADEFADWKAPLVVAALPANAGEWTAAPVAQDDPRWVLGRPPRSRANYAWLQHALWHQEPGGATVLLACNSLLHSSTGSEGALRRSLAESGRVRLVVSLPARIFADDRPAMSLVVLGDPSADPACLMVDALGTGVASPEVDPALFAGEVRPAGVAARSLPREVAERVAAVCEAWLARGEAVEDPGFARAVTAVDLAAHDGALTPWSYV